MARIILGGEMSIQAPPNLTPEGPGDTPSSLADGWTALLRAGINDWGASVLMAVRVAPAARLRQCEECHPWIARIFEECHAVNHQLPRVATSFVGQGAVMMSVLSWDRVRS